MKEQRKAFQNPISSYVRSVDVKIILQYSSQESIIKQESSTTTELN